MKNMKKIRCIRGSDEDWKEDLPVLRWRWPVWILCDAVSREWWDTTDAEVIDVKVSSYNTKSSYLCKLSGGGSGSFFIFDEGEEHWRAYCLFSELHDIVSNHVKSHAGNEFYLGVDIVR